VAAAAAAAAAPACFRMCYFTSISALFPSFHLVYTPCYLSPSVESNSRWPVDRHVQSHTHTTHHPALVSLSPVPPPSHLPAHLLHFCFFSFFFSSFAPSSFTHLRRLHSNLPIWCKLPTSCQSSHPRYRRVQPWLLSLSAAVRLFFPTLNARVPPYSLTLYLALARTTPASSIIHASRLASRPSALAALSIGARDVVIQRGQVRYGHRIPIPSSKSVE
jgi:hypothetical protein